MFSGLLKKIYEKLGKADIIAGDIPVIDLGDTDNALTVAMNEIKQIYPHVYSASEDNRHSLTENDLFSFMKPIHDSLTSKKRDYAKLCEIAPEIKNAESILIPSILSPNSLQPISELNITIPIEGLEEELRTKIIKILSYHFNNELKIYSKLGNWISTALIREGAKPLLVIPCHVIRKLKEQSIGSSNESLESFNKRIFEKSIYNKKMDNKSLNYSIECIKGIDFNTLSESITHSLEDSIFEALKETGQNEDLMYKHKTLELSLEAVTKIIEDSKAKDMVTFVENPEIIVLKNYKRKKAIKDIDNEFDSFILEKSEKSINTPYKQEPLVDISSLLSLNPEEEDIYPLIEELPLESVIPITTKANPECHLAYFIVLDEDGSPINSNDEELDDMSASKDEGSVTIDRLFSAMKGGNNIKGLLPNNVKILQSSYAADMKKRTISKIIDTYIDIAMRKNLENIGMSSFDISLNNTIQSTMMRRILRRKRTHILFVPKSILFYMAFDYNEDGTGKSKLENIKFPLSLKMTFIITKIMALIESATNQKRIEVQLDDNKGLNHLEILRTIKNRFLQSRLGGISYDPSTIMKGIAERTISVMPKNIPGIQSFDIKDDSSPKTLPRPEPELLDMLDNMYILGLDVPPSTLNQLGENEFSRSISTFNFFFSNKIIRYQGIICDQLSGLFSCYTKYSRKLRSDIYKVLSEENVKLDNIKGDANPEEQPETKDTERLQKILTMIISSVRVTLSSPKIIYDKAQYDEIQKYTEIINGLVDSLYPEEMIEDSELTDSFKVFKTFLKADLVSKYLNDISAFSQFNIESLSEMDFLKISGTKQSMMNLNKLLKDLKTKIAEAVPENNFDTGESTEEPEMTEESEF